MRRLIVSIPHSGERVPPETPWLQSLPEPVLMCDVDRFVDQLYRPTLLRLKIQHVLTDWHRYVVDLNRLAGDHDVSTVIGSTNPAGSFARGIHWAHTTKQDALMNAPISQELHQQLIAKYFEPFHSNIKKLVAELVGAGIREILHLDLHSMPSIGTSEHRDPGQKRADVVISDNRGRSAAPELFQMVTSAFQKTGFTVAVNWPYYGGRITEVYGQPQSHHHAIQVELNRALYMDETSKKSLPALWPSLQRLLDQAIEEVQRNFEGRA